MFRRTLQIAAISLFIGTLCAQEYIVEVTRVYSGDTVAVRRNDRTGRLKIRGIRCPDPETSVGDKALRFLEAAALDKWVKVRELGKDTDDVNLGRVFIGEREVALDLLRAGLVEYDSSTLSSMEFSEAQELARAAGIGVWGAPEEAPPSVAERAEDEASAPAEDEAAQETVQSEPGPPADQTFDKVDFVEHKGEDRKELNAKITFTGDELIIMSEKGDREFGRIPYESVEEASYEQSTHTRWEKAVVPSVFGMGDKKKHWLTVIWRKDGENEYTTIRLDKDNYQEIVQTFEARVRIQVRWATEFELPKF